jgi:hypothetical protein
VTQFARPVLAEALLASAEMRLRCPGEVAGSIGSTADEGEGTGFDNSFPFAYAERWFEVDDEGVDVERWFDARVRPLGWDPADTPSEMTSWTRDGDEHLGLARFGPPSASRPRYRLHYRVDGVWPDGAQTGNDVTS